METIEVKVNGGKLVATACADPNYPGIDVEFVPDVDDEEVVSYPRILVEKVSDPNNSRFRALVWGNPKSEDYSQEVNFSV